MSCVSARWRSWLSTRHMSCVSTMIVVRRSPAARSLGRSLARSLARSIDHSLARSLARSIARSLTDMCSLQSQYKGAAFGRHHKGGRAPFGRAAPFVVSVVLTLQRAHVSERSSERVIDGARDRASERPSERATGERAAARSTKNRSRKNKNFYTMF